jgi:hypothetical protein
MGLDKQDEEEVVAAIYLFALTGEEKYNELVKNRFYTTSPFYDIYSYLYFSHVGDALLYYTTLENADVNAHREILSQRRKEGNGLHLFQFRPKDDLYMGYMTGSGTVRNWMGIRYPDSCPEGQTSGTTAPLLKYRCSPCKNVTGISMTAIPRLHGS